MMCFAWEPRQACYNAGPEAGKCPSIGWFWALAAAAGLLLMGGKGKQKAK